MVRLVITAHHTELLFTDKVGSSSRFEILNSSWKQGVTTEIYILQYFAVAQSSKLTHHFESMSPLPPLLLHCAVLGLTVRRRTEYCRLYSVSGGKCQAGDDSVWILCGEMSCPVNQDSHGSQYGVSDTLWVNGTYKYQ